MARMPRVVVPGYPHHVTQRGSRRQRTFFNEADYSLYLELLAEARQRAGIEFWAYCLMPNHVHHVVVPHDKTSLTVLFREAHRRYTRKINCRNGWRGHLWQERFHSFVTDERHLLAAVRYVELNPVRAGLVEQPEAWPWSSARAHLRGRNDRLVEVHPMLSRVGDWGSYLTATDSQEMIDAIRMHTRTGRPQGSDSFLAALEEQTGRSLRKKKPGPKSARQWDDGKDK